MQPLSALDRNAATDDAGLAMPFPSPAAPREPFGAWLIRHGLITQDQLRIALHEQKRGARMLGDALVDLGFLDEDTRAHALAVRADLPVIDLSGLTPPSDLTRIIPKYLALRTLMLPFHRDEDMLHLAVADPYDLPSFDDIRRRFPRETLLAPHVAAPSAIRAAIERGYGSADALDAIVRELETGATAPAAPGEAWTHPVVRLADALLSEAARRNASDVHLEPANGFVRIRYRIDGQLVPVRSLHRDHWPALLHRLKIMAGMNIAETRATQDGRFRLPTPGGDIDCRAAIMPTVWGETIVVRLLDHRRALLSLTELGFDSTARAALERLIDRPQGITLVTGPTGSGKTTTLYALLSRLSHDSVNIATLEEPVEYQLDMVRQTAVQEAHGLGFAEGVRGMLRMDPDIMLIGEIRDAATAQMALRAAMTGHQVFSTLHCHDALGAVPRLVDLGLPRGMLAGHLTGIVAQRLVRTLCPACRRDRAATDDECVLLGVSSARIGVPVGCAACDGLGTKGRVALAEVLTVTPALGEAIAAGASRADLLAEAKESGFRSLRADGIARVLAGDMTLDDLRRAVDLYPDGVAGHS